MERRTSPTNLSVKIRGTQLSALLGERLHGWQGRATSAPARFQAKRLFARRASPAGFTLMEAMIASSVLAVAVVGISGVLSSSYAQSAGQEKSSIGLSLARQLMEEITARPVALPNNAASNPGWASGVSDRRLYDTVNDYNGYTDTSGSITTLGGQSVNVGGGETFTRSVVVTSGVRPTGHTVAPAGDFFAVRVTVIASSGKAVSLSQFVTKATIAR